MGKKKRAVSGGTLRQASSSQAGISSKSGFNPDYSYVLKDLKRIGMIAAVLILGLIGLSFLL